MSPGCFVIIRFVARIGMQTMYKMNGTAENTVRMMYTLDGVSMRSVAEPGWYLIVHNLQNSIDQKQSLALACGLTYVG